jgi:predicted RNase H-like HicB family nuclease
MQYAVVVHSAEEGGFWAEVPLLPGCMSQGDTLDETLANTRDAIQGWIEYLRDKGENIPEHDDVVVTVEVAA